MEVSSSSMKVARVTVRAMIQGLMGLRKTAGFGEDAICGADSVRVRCSGDSRTLDSVTVPSFPQHIYETKRSHKRCGLWGLRFGKLRGWSGSGTEVGVDPGVEFFE